jgi:hypothetical protein
MNIFRHRLQMSSLDRLEREANDDFHLLAELGPEYFEIEHLAELREQSHERLKLFDLRRRLAKAFGIAAAGWVLLALLSSVLQVQWLSITAFGFTALSASGFLGIRALQKVHFKSRAALEFTLKMIEDELRKRAMKKTA